jgi:hypothetical protein
MNFTSFAILRTGILLSAASIFSGATAIAADTKPTKAPTEAKSTKAELEAKHLARTINLEKGTTLEKAHSALVTALNFRHWTVEKNEPSEIAAYYFRKPITVNITIKVLSDKIEIWSQAQGSHSKVEKKENQWLNNLVKDTQTFLYGAPPSPTPTPNAK